MWPFYVFCRILTSAFRLRLRLCLDIYRIVFFMNPNRAHHSKKFLTDMLSGCRSEEMCEVINYIPFCRTDLCQKNVECLQDPTNLDTLCVSTTRMPGLLLEFRR